MVFRRRQPQSLGIEPGKLESVRKEGVPVLPFLFEPQSQWWSIFAWCPLHKRPPPIPVVRALHADYSRHTTSLAECVRQLMGIT